VLEVNLLFDTILVTSGCGFIGSCFILQQMEQHPDIRLFNLDALTILLTQNFATGCTMLVERSVSERALPIRKEAIVHDWWLALVAASYGHVLYLDRPAIMYRQHGSNAIGMNTTTAAASLKRIMTHPVGRLKHGMTTCTSCARQLDAFESRITECYAATSTIRHMHRVGVAIAYAGVRSVVRLLRQRIRQRAAFSIAEWISCVN